MKTMKKWAALLMGVLVSVNLMISFSIGLKNASAETAGIDF